jgi:hypothetical protein
LLLLLLELLIEFEFSNELKLAWKFELEVDCVIGAVAVVDGAS